MPGMKPPPPPILDGSQRICVERWEYRRCPTYLTFCHVNAALTAGAAARSNDEVRKGLMIGKRRAGCRAEGSGVIEQAEQLLI